MNERVMKLVENYFKPFRRALHVDPDTLKNQHPSVCLIRLRSRTKEELKSWSSEGEPKYYSEAIELILKTLASNTGLPLVIVESPDGGFSDTLVKELRNVGLCAKVRRTTRHRYCDHINGRGESCNYDGDADGGAGEIADDLLFVYIPFPTLEEKLNTL